MVAALSEWHRWHTPASEALATIRALPAHALLETYSVLTRLPSGLAVEPALAAGLLRERFDLPPLVLDASRRLGLPAELAAAGVPGGSAYDGVVALEASANGHTLLTLDVRAQRTYQRLGVMFTAIAD